MNSVSRVTSSEERASMKSRKRKEAEGSDAGKLDLLPSRLSADLVDLEGKV